MLRFLYIKKQFTNNKIVLATTIIIFILLIFPIFLTSNIAFIGEHKKIYFSIYMFNIFYLLGGYIEIKSVGIVIHFTKIKAKIIKFKSIKNITPNVSIVKDYHIKSVNAIIDVGTNKNLITTSSICFLIDYISKFIFQNFKMRKPYLYLSQEINIYENKKIFNNYLNITIMFNLIVIILSFIKILIGKLIYEFRKREQN